jgi:hypothetical protein
MQKLQPFAVLASLALMLAVACSAREAAAANFSLKIDAPKATKVGQPTKVGVRVVPQSGWKVNLKYPIRLRLQPPAGVELAKAELVAADAQVSEQEAKFEVTFTARDSGAKTVTGELKFSVCVSDKCDIKKETVSWTTSAR